MTTLHLVSHTHWDREWYLTFQQFRLELIRLIDDLLDLLATNPDEEISFKHFMLDGQTIVLDDYLQIRPERELELRRHVQNGRLLVGPWYVLPDEFLVSPEATIRNLLQGEHSARRFGTKMQVGYLPDPFGHIGQMPQILTGFGIQTASLRRGLDDHPCEMWWRAPDGSIVLLAYLRDGYDNAASLPVANPEVFTTEVTKLRDSLLPHCATSHILLMQGTDHMFPQPATPEAVAFAVKQLAGDSLVHSTLPGYLAAVRTEIANSGDRASLPVITGELRSSKRHHLLPGVLSTRIWIKQRNHTCETLLEKWAEPFSALAVALAPQSNAPRNPNAALRYAWQLLMECHPHDSICGCSIDQVHKEMRPRFDQVQQVGEEITRQALEVIAAQIGTWPSPIANPSLLPFVVFNPAGISRSEAVTVRLPFSKDTGHFEIIDEAGQILPHLFESSTRYSIAHLDLDRQGLVSLLGGVSDGTVSGPPISRMTIQDVKLKRSGDALHIQALLTDFGPPNSDALERVAPEIASALADESLEKFIVEAESDSSQVSFVAPDVPAIGYRTFWVRRTSHHAQDTHRFFDLKHSETGTISNEFFSLEFSPAAATFTLSDLRSGIRYPGLSRFLDGGDRGDTYNYCPPENDWLAEGQVQSVHVEHGLVEQSIRVELELSLPTGLTDDRESRSAESAPMTVVTTASLARGLPRLDFHTEIHNTAKDHRLRVHFPTPFSARHANYDGHFEIVSRPIGSPSYDETWVEAPRPEAPQRAFTAVSGERSGNSGSILIANRGLPEVEVFTNHQGHAEIALTLLRCIGWLSRDDLTNRKGPAGPQLATPGAQMLGRYSFDYAVIPYEIDKAVLAYQQAYAFSTPLRAIPTDFHHGELPQRESFFQIEPHAFIVSTIKFAEDGRGLILRGYNITGEPIQVTVKPLIHFQEVVRTNLAEDQDMTVGKVGDLGAAKLDLGGHQVATLRFCY